MKSEYKTAGAESIQNLQAVQKWFNEPKKFKERFELLRNNIDEYTKIFGPNVETFEGSEYRFKVWRVEHEGETFWLLSAKGYGSAIESTCTNESKVIKFLEWLLKKVST